MSIEVDIPKELEFKIKANKELNALVKRRIERQISTDIKNDVFISMICDDLLKDSELEEKDIDQIDHKIKRGIERNSGEAAKEIDVDTNIIISAFLKDGMTRRILLLSPFDMHTIACAQEEIDAHKIEFIQKSRINDEQFEYMMQLIFSKMSLIPPADIEPFRVIAEHP